MSTHNFSFLWRNKTKYPIDHSMLCVADWVFTPHQQLSSYGDGTSVLISIQKTGGSLGSNSGTLVYEASSFTKKMQISLCVCPV